MDRRSEAIAQLLETALEERFDVAPLDLDVARLQEMNAAKTEFLSMAAHVRFRPGPTGRIDMRLTEVDGAWRISVLDDGFGIEPENQGQLFKRFARLETNANQHLVGMGIGLYLVQEVARAHGGRVMVDSRPVGSEFRLELPRRQRKGDSGPE